MIKQLAWNTFKNTGDINTFMELMEVQNIEKNLKKRLTFPTNGGIISKLTRESGRHRTLKTIQKQQRKGKTVIPNE